MRRFIVAVLILCLGGCARMRAERSDRWYEREVRREDIKYKTKEVGLGVVGLAGLGILAWLGCFSDSDEPKAGASEEWKPPDGSPTAIMSDRR